MKLASFVEDSASKLFEVLSAKATRNDSAVLFVQVYHGLDPDLLIHRLVVQLVDFVVLLDCLLYAVVVGMVLPQGFAILPQKQLILRRTLDRLDDVRFNVQTESLLDFYDFWYLFERLYDLLPLHEVVAILSIDHEKLIERLELFTDDRFMGMPGGSGTFDAASEVETEVDHGL